MKLQRILRVSIGVLCASAGVSAQGVVSQLGGFLERAQDVPLQESAALPSAASLLLQQGPPTFSVASPDGLQPAANVPAPLMASASAIPPAYNAPIATPKGLLSLRSMRVSNPGADSKVFFGAGSEFAMGTDSAGNFVVQQASAPSPLLSLDSQDTLHIGSARVETSALNVLNDISVKGVKQWQLVYSDDFSSPVTGWTRGDVTQCGGVFMLGGFCKFSAGETNKTFTGLPPHKQLRVRASYHFIDRWVGETGYMKLDVGIHGCAVPVWSEQHSEQEAQNGLSLCGNEEVPEGKFAAPIEVTVPHTKNAVSVSFGSTIGGSDACDESWGVSAVEIYVRN